MKDIYIKVKNVPDDADKDYIVTGVRIANRNNGRAFWKATDFEGAEFDIIDLPTMLKEQRELCAKVYYENFKLNIVAIHDLILNAPSPMEEKP